MENRAQTVSPAEIQGAIKTREKQADALRKRIQKDLDRLRGYLNDLELLRQAKPGATILTAAHRGGAEKRTSCGPL